jgi:hypothetical protein
MNDSSTSTSTRELCGRLVLHCFTNPVKHEPSRLLSQAEIAGDFVAAHAVLAVRDKSHRREPFAQRDGRLVEDRADLDGKLFPAFCGAALPDSASFEEHRFPGFAVRAGYTLGPTLARKVVQSIVRIVKVNNRFGHCFGGFDVKHAMKTRVCQVSFRPHLGL